MLITLMTAAAADLPTELPKEVLPSDALLRQDIAHLGPVGPADPNAPCTSDGNTRRSVARFDEHGRIVESRCWGCENLDKTQEDQQEVWTRDADGNVVGYTQTRHIAIFEGSLTKEERIWTLDRRDGQLQSVTMEVRGPDTHERRLEVQREKGRVTGFRLEDQNGEATYAYTWKGDRPVQRVQVRNGKTIGTVRWTWKGGHLVEESSGTGENATLQRWTRRADGTPVSKTYSRGGKVLSTVRYDAKGRVADIENDDGEDDTHTYDTRGNLVSIGHENAYFPVTYTYDCH